MKVLSVVATVALLHSPCSLGAEFQAFLDQVRGEAVAAGVSAELVTEAFAGLTPDERVIRFDRAQPEVVQTLDEYLAARVTDAVVAEGIAALAANTTRITALEAAHGVDGAVLIAVWGMESRYGRHTGAYSVIRSLATLAFDPRRSAFFRRELIAALRLADQEHIRPGELLGSWAGAMGQPQFMPSTYLRFAQDGDGDGARDIWHNPSDVLASIAGLLSAAGWQYGQPWGVELDSAQLPSEPRNAEGCRALREHSMPLSIGELRARGIAVPMDAPSSTTVTVWRSPPHSFVAGPNFHALLSYNCANSYALAVATLAGRIAAGG